MTYWPGVAVECRPVGHDGPGLVGVVLGRLREPVVRQVPLARHEHVGTVGLRERLRGVDDDRPVHPVRNVREDGLRTAVIHVDARVAGLELERERLTGSHVDEGQVRSDPRCMEVDRVGDGSIVRERHLHGLSLPCVHDRAGRTALESPRVVLHARCDLDRHILEDHVHLEHISRCRRRECCRERLVGQCQLLCVRRRCTRVARALHGRRCGAPAHVVTAGRARGRRVVVESAVRGDKRRRKDQNGRAKDRAAYENELHRSLLRARW